MSIKEKVLQLFFFLQILIWCPQNDEFLKNPEKIRDDQKRFSKLSIQIKWCKEFCFWSPHAHQKEETNKIGTSKRINSFT